MYGEDTPAHNSRVYPSSQQLIIKRTGLTRLSLGRPQTCVETVVRSRGVHHLHMYILHLTAPAQQSHTKLPQVTFMPFYTVAILQASQAKLLSPCALGMPTNVVSHLCTPQMYAVGMPTHATPLPAHNRNAQGLPTFYW